MRPHMQPACIRVPATAPPVGMQPVGGRRVMAQRSAQPPSATQAQSAANNFLGIHMHDTQYYLRMGSWVTPELHPRCAPRSRTATP